MVTVVDLVPIELHIPELSASQLRERAMHHWYSRRTNFGLSPKPASRVCSAYRRRKTLNFLRHKFTNYDKVDLELSKEEQAQLRDRFNQAIIEVLEELSA